MAGRVWLAIVLLAWAPPARAGGALEVTPAAAVGDQVTIDVEVRNTGDAPLSALRLDVLYQGHESHRDFAGPLVPGARHDWRVEAPRPAEPGTLPAVIHVHYEDADGSHAVPAVAAVSTPGLLPVPEVRATLTLSPLTQFARGVLVLENPLPAPVHGRVVVVLPGGLFTEPESQAAEVAANGRREIPLILQREHAPTGASLPVVTFFDYADEGRRHLVVASAETAVTDAGRTVSPLVVGAVALLAAFGCLALAWRRAARRGGHRRPLS